MIKINIKENKTINSALWYTISNVIAKGITVFLTPFITRVLSKSEYGQYTTYNSLQQILVTFFTLELGTTILRAKFDFDEKDFSNYVFSITIFELLFSSVLLAIFYIIFNNYLVSFTGLNNVIITFLYINIVFSPLMVIFQNQQRAMLKYKVSSFVTLLFAICSFALPLLMVTKGTVSKLNNLIGGITITNVLFGTAIIVIIVLGNKEKINFKYIKYALLFSIPIIPNTIASSLMGNSDKLIIKSICGDEEAAIYGIVLTCALAISLLRNSLNSAWQPWFYDKMNKSDYQKIKIASSFFIGGFSFCTLLLCLFGPELIYVFGGREYMESIKLLPFIMLGCYFNFLNLFYINIEFYNKKTFIISLVTIFVTLLGIILNIILINKVRYKVSSIVYAFINLAALVLHYFFTIKMNNKSIVNNKLIVTLVIIFIIFSTLITYIYKLLVIRILLIVSLLLLMFCFAVFLIRKGYIEL